MTSKARKKKYEELFNAAKKEIQENRERLKHNLKIKKVRALSPFNNEAFLRLINFVLKD